MGYAVPREGASFTDALDDFNETEARLGELADYLEAVADGLSHDPDSLPRILGAEWPDLPALLTLRAEWILRKKTLIAAWHALSPAERAANRLPPFGVSDPTRPVV